jgi:TPR repeat protein
LEQGCSAGNAAECDILGMRHLRGDGTAKDPKKAATYFQRACDRGDAPGCFNIAESHRYGDGVPKDPAKAAGLYQRACDGREREGCAELSLLYALGEGIEKSETEAALYADRACALDSVLGCAILGAVYAEGGDGYPKDVKRAEGLLFDACHKGTKYTEKPDQAARLACPAYTKLTGKPACYTKTIAAADASGVEVRRHCFDAQAGWVTTVTQNAAPTAAKAAPAPVAPPPTSVALNAGNAAYARKDYAAAAAQFAKACDGGSVEGCGMLGEMYATGQGVTANGKIDARLLAKACDKRIAKSCLALSALFESGTGITRYAEKALAIPRDGEAD